MPRLKGSGINERISLFSSLGLTDPVLRPNVIGPHIFCGLGVFRPHKWGLSSKSGHLMQLGEKTAPENVIVRSHAIDRQYRALGVCIGQDTDCVSDAIGSCPGRKGEMQWSAHCLHFPELASECATDKPTKRGARCDSRTPPSFFCSAVMVDIVTALVTISGASARAKSSASRRKEEVESLPVVQAHFQHLACAPGPALAVYVVATLPVLNLSEPAALYLALLHSIARCLPASLLFRIFLIQMLDAACGILANTGLLL